MFREVKLFFFRVLQPVPLTEKDVKIYKKGNHPFLVNNSDNERKHNGDVNEDIEKMRKIPSNL